MGLEYNIAGFCGCWFLKGTVPDMIYLSAAQSRGTKMINIVDIDSALDCHRLFHNNSVTPATAMSQSSTIEQEIHAAIGKSWLSDDNYNALALKLFYYQLEHNHSYRAYCRTKGVTENEVNHWSQIPALPTDAFKFPNAPVVSFPITEKKHTFLTSGTTSESHGAHHFPSLDLYETSIHNTWARLDQPPVELGVFLTPHPKQAPQSSLSHMMGVLEPMIGS